MDLILNKFPIHMTLRYFKALARIGKLNAIPIMELVHLRANDGYACHPIISLLVAERYSAEAVVDAFLKIFCKKENIYSLEKSIRIVICFESALFINKYIDEFNLCRRISNLTNEVSYNISCYEFAHTFIYCWSDFERDPEFFKIIIQKEADLWMKNYPFGPHESPHFPLSMKISPNILF